jgi:hypothetical protein
MEVTGPFHKAEVLPYRFHACSSNLIQCSHAVVDAAGTKLLHRNFKTNQLDLLLAKLQPYLQADFVLACESTFNWYWLADWCADNGIRLLLGHALYMKAIDGGKTKNDAIDSEKIARPGTDRRLVARRQLSRRPRLSASHASHSRAVRRTEPLIERVLWRISTTPAGCGKFLREPARLEILAPNARA